MQITVEASTVVVVVKAQPTLDRTERKEAALLH